MDILDRIVILLGTREQKELTDFLKLKKSAFTDWKSGKSNSYRKYLIEIAEFFNVSLDYLVYGKEDKVVIKQKDIQQINSRENELLKYFRELSDTEQIKLIARAEVLAEQAKLEENVS